MSKRCDNASVGVLITDSRKRWLMLERATYPAGIAPAAGHVFDDHDGYEQAARAEVVEELGLTVATLELLPVGGWRPNRCRRATGPRGVGHQWQIYRATVTGTLTPSSRETRGARWLTGDDLQRLASWTAYYALGRASSREFCDEPGIEPVWVRFLLELDLIRMDPADLVNVERLARQPHAPSR